MGWNVINEVRATYPNLEFQSHTYNMHHRGGVNGVARSWSLASSTNLMSGPSLASCPGLEPIPGPASDCEYRDAFG